jgi:hypothetical protein
MVKEVIYKIMQAIRLFDDKVVAVVLENKTEGERHQRSKETQERIQIILVYKMAKVSKLLMNKQTITKELHCKITSAQCAVVAAVLKRKTEKERRKDTKEEEENMN